MITARNVTCRSDVVLKLLPSSHDTTLSPSHSQQHQHQHPNPLTLQPSPSFLLHITTNSLNQPLPSLELTALSPPIPVLLVGFS